ncbi:lysylphosphatidylglycerol synthase domain-containing protein [Pseudomonas sp. NP21570]|uniref:lysylphosphatidylglycerol synthase transmembrane domain-containing protein n=1 Tax=Stutzerimonas kunmingensis TaxID=1211807 RepID=UPI001E5EF6C0|nr:YbhN family protein [Stutzerimonas kunmingensis]MCB4796751.1 lysylphosphatidylglycerol synthase domain-containing protein [Pseudomonas sp. NP21570]UIP35003.1 lysylphosphatidylglycerol synthase domain-containing protein [Stutzerimonas kunmingensis]
MMKRSDVAWTLIGVLAVLLSGYLLYHEVRNISLSELTDSLQAIGARRWLLAALSTLGAYVALAWYDRIAMAHLGKKMSWWFIALCSFTTYALAHNIGASVFSGALVRYRAYRSRGLTPQEIGILIVFCSLTFALGTLLAGGAVLILKPQLLHRAVDSDSWVSIAVGSTLLMLVALYAFGAWRQLPPWRLGKWHIEYPRLPIVGRQLLAGPLELLCAAAIIYFALPPEHSPGYLTVLGVFLASFTLALLSHAPGGLGVLELTFVAALPEIPTVDVLAALIVFRGFYLLLPFALAMIVVLIFEYGQWRAKRSAASEH